MAHVEAPLIDPDKATAFDRLFLRLIRDPRDLAFGRLWLHLFAVMAVGLCMYLPGVWSWPLAAAYLLAWVFLSLDRYILMLHCTSHRVLFKREYRALNRVIPWVMGPFFGQTPETYFSHHMGMHHPENNLADDLSSTMKYHRGRFSNWLLYFGDFLLFGSVRLPAYHARKGNKKMARSAMIGEYGWVLSVIALCTLHWQATLTVFILPVLIARVLMMCGNWGQHAFVDAADPGNPYRNSITCIHSRYNRRAFNDGYHIHHHVKPRCHWADLPGEFEDNRAVYGAQDAIVFEGLDFFSVWLFLMLGWWGPLVKAFVRLPGAPERSDGEIRQLLESRLQPIPIEAPAEAVAAV